MVSFTHDGPGTPPQAWHAHDRWTTLPPLDLGADLERVVVLAAHPDDESLGAGGVMARAHRRGIDVVVVAATDGEASHPASPTHSPARLAAIRRGELRAAVSRSAPGADVHHLGMPDGGLDNCADELVDALVGLVGDGRRTLIVAPWRRDGHPDHDAAGRAAMAAAARTGSDLWQYPIWFWHWAQPDQAPWGTLAAVDLDAGEMAAKADAQAEHRSQIAPLSERPGDETLLSAELLRHFRGPREVFVREVPRDTALDDLHARTADPWGVNSRWYERRKRDLLLAMLPRRRFRQGVEIGGSTGALAAGLADRCDTLLVLDSSSHAAQAARLRLGAHPRARVQVAAVPRDWPTPPTTGFDLVVLSEAGYFLSPADLDALIGRIQADLAADGVLILCHWRHAVRGWPLDGPDVHDAFIRSAVRPVIARYTDRDAELLVLADPGCLPDPQAGG